MTESALPGTLRAARRVLDGVEGVSVCGEWQWKPAATKWAIRLQLTPGIEPTEQIPSTSDWIVLADPHYPAGAVTFYPAMEGGLTATFPHQHFNAEGDDDWRLGDICLEDYLASLGRSGISSEPEDSRGRLAWRVERALEWIRAAAEDRLLPSGSPYELPNFPETAWSPRVVFVEGADSYATWKQHDSQWGSAEFARSAEVRNTLAVRKFYDRRGELLHEVGWGHLFADPSCDVESGLWIRLPQAPAIEPWQAPQTWGELRQVAERNGVDFDTLLRTATRRMRDGHSHILLIGFPVARVMSMPPVQMHWQAIELQPLCLSSRVRDGFRPNETGQWHTDRYGQLASSQPIAWRPSENWHADELSTRGRLPDRIRGLNVALVGVGALGSAVAELLVRAGVVRIHLIDTDILLAGNLVRHVLTLSEIDQAKAVALAKRLNAVNPAACVEVSTKSFEMIIDHGDLSEDVDLIIDTTGSNDVTTALGKLDSQRERDIVSLSMSLGATRLYCYAARGRRFPNDDFREKIEPLIVEDHERFTGELPWEGTGCWHPVFPARSDDVWLLAAAGVKRLQRWLGSPRLKSELTLIEQVLDNEGFAGVRVY